jgi:hypothetical protein
MPTPKAVTHLAMDVGAHQECHGKLRGKIVEGQCCFRLLLDVPCVASTRGGTLVLISDDEGALPSRSFFVSGPNAV